MVLVLKRWNVPSGSGRTSSGRARAPQSLVCEFDGWIRTASAVIRTVPRFVVVKMELSQKAKLTSNHEVWIRTEITRSWKQASSEERPGSA